MDLSRLNTYTLVKEYHRAEIEVIMHAGTEVKMRLMDTSCRLFSSNFSYCASIQRYFTDKRRFIRCFCAIFVHCSRQLRKVSGKGKGSGMLAAGGGGVLYSVGVGGPPTGTCKIYISSHFCHFCHGASIRFRHEDMRQH